MAKQNRMTAVAKTEKPSLGLVAMFGAGPAVNGKTKQMPKGLVRRNMPGLVKPADVPIGACVSGEIVKIIPSPNTTIKGKLIWLKHESGREFLFPLTGQIRSALFPGMKDGKDLDEAVAKETEIGKTLYAVRGEDKPSKYKRAMFSFDVYTQERV